MGEIHLRLMRQRRRGHLSGGGRVASSLRFVSPALHGACVTGEPTVHVNRRGGHPGGERPRRPAPLKAVDVGTSRGALSSPRERSDQWQWPARSYLAGSPASQVMMAVRAVCRKWYSRAGNVELTMLVDDVSLSTRRWWNVRLSGGL